jgi:hypothetical protein
MSFYRSVRLRDALRLLLSGSLLFCLVLILSACDGNYLVWSSDGKLGAIVGARGLRVCEGDGSISAVLIEKAGMFRWLPQEHQGLLVGYNYVSKWSELKPLLAGDQEKRVVEESGKLKRKVYAYRGDPKKFAESSLKTLDYPLEAALHLHGTSTPDFEKMVTRKWPSYPSVKVPIFFIRQAQVEAQSARPGRIVDRGIDEIVELRVSPNGKYLACVKHESAQECNYITVMPLAGGRAVTVAGNTNLYPDWSADSRFLYFSRANNEAEPDLLKGHGLHEGGLFRAEVVDASGRPLASPRPQRLANLIFDRRGPVRSLKDGRVLFVSREIRLPGGVNTSPASVLFCLEGNRVESIFRRNEDVVYFEPSPEHDQLSISLGGGSLLVCKAGGSDLTELCNGRDVKLSGLLPQWKSNQELSYGTEVPSGKGGKPTYAISLWTRGSTAPPRELSKSWGREANQEIIIHRDIFQEAMSGVMEDMER